MKYKGYRGNLKLLREGEAVAYTQFEKDEFDKCRADVFYFIENYVKIVHVDYGLIQFMPFPWQKKLVDIIEKNRFSIFKVARQSGKTTIVIAFILWYVIFHENKKIGVLAHRSKTAVETFGKLRTAYENLPRFLQMGVTDGGWNKSSISLANGSRVVADATTGGSLRGETYNIVFLDEFAHVDNNAAAEFMDSVMPVISSGQTTKIIIVSTPKGMNHFYDRWIAATEKRSQYEPLEVNWYDVPGRDEKFKQMVIENEGLEHWKQEYLCDFLGSAATLISAEKLEELRAIPPMYSKDSFSIYEEPKKGHQYCICVDPSRGLGQDYHAFCIIDVTNIPFKLVGMWRNNQLTPTLIPNIVLTSAQKYNEAHVLIEISDLGIQIADMLAGDLDYENIIKIAARQKTGQTIALGYAKGRIQNGIKTSVATKRIGCTNLKTLIENDKLIIQDKQTIEELYRFVPHTQSYAAEVGAHDDCVMTLVLFAWLVHQRYFRMDRQDIRSNLEEEYEKYLEEQLTPFGIVDDGLEEISDVEWSVINEW